MTTNKCGTWKARCGIVLLLLTVLGIMSYRDSMLFVLKSSQIARGYQIEETLEKMKLLLKEDESALRGFALTGNTDFLKPCTAVRAQLPGLQDHLEKVLERHRILSRRTPTASQVEKQEDLAWDPLKQLLVDRLDCTDVLAAIGKLDNLAGIEEHIKPATARGQSFLNECREGISGARTGLEALRTLIAQGKGENLSREIGTVIDEIGKLEEKPLEERLSHMRHEALELGDVLVAAHFVYIAIVVVGLLLVLIGAALGWHWIRNIWFRLIHLTMILIVVVEALLAIQCPLTIWENQMKRSADQTSQDGGFIARWMHQMIIYDHPTDPNDEKAQEDHKNLEKNLEYGYMAFGAVVLASFVLAPPRLRRKTDGKTGPSPTDAAAVPTPPPNSPSPPAS